MGQCVQDHGHCAWRYTSGHILFMVFVLTSVGHIYGKGEGMRGCVAALVWLANCQVHLYIGTYHNILIYLIDHYSLHRTTCSWSPPSCARTNSSWAAHIAFTLTYTRLPPHHTPSQAGKWDGMAHADTHRPTWPSVLHLTSVMKCALRGLRHHSSPHHRLLLSAPTQSASSHINEQCHCPSAACKVVQSHLGFCLLIACLPAMHWVKPWCCVIYCLGLSWIDLFYNTYCLVINWTADFP